MVLRASSAGVMFCRPMKMVSTAPRVCILKTTVRMSAPEYWRPTRSNSASCCACRSCGTTSQTTSPVRSLKLSSKCISIGRPAILISGLGKTYPASRKASADPPIGMTTFSDASSRMAIADMESSRSRGCGCGDPII
eukprot:scaffold2741_cov134-Isochrysis_galbana.AAC.2